MVEPEDKPPEQKLSPWKQFLEDLSWDITFVRAFGNLFLGILYEEGKGVKSGWFAFIIFTVIAFWGGCHYSERNIDEKLSGITNYFGGELSKSESRITSLKDELDDAKRDRDKYQTDFLNAQNALAPWMELANSQFSNAPISKRLTLLFNQAEENTELLTNAIENLNAEKATIGLSVNDIVLTNVDITRGAAFTNTFIYTSKTNDIIFGIICASKTIPAINPVIRIVADINQTNIVTDGWSTEPKYTSQNQWICIDQKTLAYPTQTIFKIKVLPNFKQVILPMQVYIHANNASPLEYGVVFVFTE